MLYQLSYSRLILPKETRKLVTSNFRVYDQIRLMWGEQDSNLRRHLPADLQSAPVGRFGISPIKQSLTPKTHIYKIFQEPMKGFEPPTCRLQISCSDQLSYIGNLKNSPLVHNPPLKNGLQMYEFKFYYSK
jgi:hypothetical protein